MLILEDLILISFYFTVFFILICINFLLQFFVCCVLIFFHIAVFLFPCINLLPFFCVFFFRYGRVESVKVLPKRGSEGGVAAFVDFVDIKSAQKAHNAINKMGDRDLRTDYNEPGTIPSAARGLDDTLTLGSRGRDVTGFTRAAGGAVYGPPTSLHSRDGRYERRLDG